MLRLGPLSLLLLLFWAAIPACHQGARRDAIPGVTASSKRPSGFFELYQKGARLYLVVPRKQLGQEFLLHARIARGIGIAPLFTGRLTINAPVSLVEHDGRLYLMRHQLNLTARGELGRAIDRAYGPSVLETAKIESRRRDGALVVDIRHWVLGELGNAGGALQQVDAENTYALSNERCFVESVRAFPDNVNIRVSLTYMASIKHNGLETVADARSIPISVQYQFVRMPAQPMLPRAADDRVGYFLSAQRDFSSDDAELFSRHIWRWRLEGAPTGSGLRRAKKPIVYYLDPAIPAELRPVITDAVQSWQPAFTAAGWSAAIRAEPLPEGADPEDLRYPLIHWDLSEEAPTGMGMLVGDPRSGEILGASITLNAGNLLRHSRNARRLYSGGSNAFDERPQNKSVARPAPSLTLDSAANSLENSEMATEFQAQHSLLRSSLIAAGALHPGDPLPQRVFHQYVKFVTMHEIGHTLGLRHNFKSSADTPVDKLSDMTWVREHGLCASVMDYPAINLPTGPTPLDFLYYQEQVGTADRWAIAYGYADSDSHAAELARQAAHPGHSFATDEDAELGLDPTVRTWDLGAEPLDWAAQRMATIRQLLVALPERLLRDNAPYYELSEAIEDLLAEYGRAAAALPAYIGGQYHVRDHVGDPAGRLPLMPVPKEKQLAALRLLISQVLAEPALELSRTALSGLASQRWRHWGASERQELGSSALAMISALRRAALRSLLRESRLRHIRDGELRFGSAAVLTVPELLTVLSQALLGDMASGSPIGTGRRELQQLYIEQLASFALTPHTPVISDLRALARSHLSEAAQLLATEPKGQQTTEPYTRAHLAELQVRIHKVLSSQITVAL